MARSMYERVVAWLQDSLDELERIEKDTGISKWTLQKIRLRQIENPGVKSIEALDVYRRSRRRSRLPKVA